MILPETGLASKLVGVDGTGLAVVPHSTPDLSELPTELTART